jgi:hypothetical protein
MPDQSTPKVSSSPSRISRILASMRIWRAGDHSGIRVLDLEGMDDRVAVGAVLARLFPVDDHVASGSALRHVPGGVGDRTDRLVDAHLEQVHGDRSLDALADQDVDPLLAREHLEDLGDRGIANGQ